MPIAVLFKDDHCLLVNKPPGLLSVPGLVSKDNLFDLVLAEYPNARVVHRLDMATSGVIAFALNHPTQKYLGKAFEQKHIKKTYIAVVVGNVPCDQGSIQAPLICDWPNRPMQKVDWQNGKPACTRFRVITRGGSSTRLQLKPVTGRSHQLRVHCQYLGFPIMGDALYSCTEQQPAKFDDQTPTRMCLHAQELVFPHPKNGEYVTVSCEPDF